MSKILSKQIITILMCLIFCQSTYAFAEVYSNLKQAKYLLLVDQDTNEVLLEKNADDKLVPSSMTKLMTAYVIFDQLKQGKINLGNECVIGRDAWKKTGSKMFLNYGDLVTIDKLIAGLLVVSGNDAAIALAEASSGSVENFVDLMNKTGEKIGLKNSHFRNPHGLYQDGHYMSLRDLAIVSNRISSDFPQHLHYFSTPEFTYQNITQHNRNPLIKQRYVGATGMKTGHTNEGGYGIVGAASRDSRRLLAITNEVKTPQQRAKIVTELLDYGFNNYKKITLFSPKDNITKVKTWLGTKSEVDLVSNKEVAITVPKAQELDSIKLRIKYKGPIYTPIAKDQKIATLTVTIDDKKIQEIPLFAKEKVDKASFLSRIYQVTKHQLRNLKNRV